MPTGLWFFFLEEEKSRETRKFYEIPKIITNYLFRELLLWRFKKNNKKHKFVLNGFGLRCHSNNMTRELL